MNLLKNAKTVVIPAQAGMILALNSSTVMFLGYPCTSGDDPITLSLNRKTDALSLHKRGMILRATVESVI